MQYCQKNGVCVFCLAFLPKKVELVYVNAIYFVFCAEAALYTVGYTIQKDGVLVYNCAGRLVFLICACNLKACYAVVALYIKAALCVVKDVYKRQVFISSVSFAADASLSVMTSVGEGIFS